uniref:Uncharacterized protein n=1 Tax=Glossina palpalis gambiensis TaxID=67801 RepID=A0A1B0BRM2_9MUSC
MSRIVCEVPAECTFATPCNFRFDCGDNSSYFYRPMWTQPLLPQAMESSCLLKSERIYNGSYASNCGDGFCWAGHNLSAPCYNGSGFNRILYAMTEPIAPRQDMYRPASPTNCKVPWANYR